MKQVYRGRMPRTREAVVEPLACTSMNPPLSRCFRQLFESATNERSLLWSAGKFRTNETHRDPRSGRGVWVQVLYFREATSGMWSERLPPQPKLSPETGGD